MMKATHTLTDIKIPTQTHATLMASVFTPNTPIKSAVMIAPATGIKRQFYQNFAEFLAKNGYAVITFDNEGIGDSLDSDIAKCPASLISWGRYDMTAVLDTLIATFGDTQ